MAVDNQSSDKSAAAHGKAQQANFFGDNYGPVVFSRRERRPLRQLPAPAPDFTGRESEISGLLNRISLDDQLPQIVNIFGMPGVGKSALAIKLATELTSTFDGDHVYVDARVADASVPIKLALEGILVCLGIPMADLPSQLSLLAAHYRSQLKPRSLILVDNADSGEFIAQLMPGLGAGLVIVTSWDPLDDVAGVYSVGLAPLSADHAIRMLVGDRKLDEVELSAATEVAGYCGNLPVALRIASSILRRTAWNMTRLVETLASTDTRLARLSTRSRTVSTVFAVAVQALTDLERRGFTILGMAPRRTFDVKLARALVTLVIDDAFADDTLSSLEYRRLLEVSGIDLEMHELLWLYAKQLASRDVPTNQRERVAGALRAWADEALVSRYVPGLGLVRVPVALLEGSSLKSIDEVYVDRAVRSDAGATTLREAFAKGSRRVLLVGPGGSGKTTAVKSLGARMFHDSRVLPITVNARDLASLSDVTTATILDHIAAMLDQVYGCWVPAQLLIDMFEQGKCALIVDGLDEVVDAEVRMRVADDIDRFAAAYLEAPIMITSRPSPDLVGNFFSFTHVSFEPLSPSEMSEIVRRSLGRRADVPSRRWPRPNTLGALSADTPLTSLLLAQIAGQKQNIGTSTTLEMVSLMTLMTARESSRGTSGTMPAHIRTIARHVAYLMQCAVDGSRNAMRESDLVKRLGRSEFETVVRLPIVARTRAPGDESLTSFTHAVFREHLAAEFVSEMPIGNVLDVIRSRAEDASWRPVLVSSMVLILSQQWRPFDQARLRGMASRSHATSEILTAADGELR